MDIQGLLRELGVDIKSAQGSDLDVHSPIDGEKLTSLSTHSVGDVEGVIQQANTAFKSWRRVPAPKRGELVRLLGDELRIAKDALGQLVTIECGKVLEEGKGEVQEMIDICDFATGLSRQLYGLTITSERQDHIMQENWHPLGVVGVISAFNFPVAVWSWNAALAFACGDPVIWKPSEKTPLTALACQAAFERAAKQFTQSTGIDVPAGLSSVIIGKADIGQHMVDSNDVALISATGSSRMGRIVGPRVAGRFGKCLLELGGNNAAVVTPSADLDVAVPSIVFGAVGTAGQRCTSTRRLFVHTSRMEEVLGKLKPAFASIADAKIGDPLKPSTLVGPLIDKDSFETMQNAVAKAKSEGGTVHHGGRVRQDAGEGVYYVAPALVEMPTQSDVVMTETFAPILYVMAYDSLSDVMELHNAVPQGLSSAIFTTDIREAEYFKHYSDCGITNVNIGTSGAEIGGAFGGEKETGGGRESGSDAWKAYMRRQTSTSYWGADAPELAQGISFG